MSSNTDWITELRAKLEKFDLLHEDELEVYFLLLTSDENMLGSTIMDKLPSLKKTHMYALLNKLEKDGWIEIVNPSERPAKYRGLDPLRILRQEIANQELQLQELKSFEEFVENTVLPNLTTKLILGGRITKTFIIPSITDLISQIKIYLDNAQSRICIHSSLPFLNHFKKELINNLHRIIENKYPNMENIPFEYVRDRFPIIITDVSNRDSLENQFFFPIAIGTKDLNYHTLIIDDTTFLTNLTHGIAITLRVQDQVVSSIYSLVLTQTLLEEMSKEHVEITNEQLEKTFHQDTDLISVVHHLFLMGFKYFEYHSNPDKNEIGLIAPGSERILFKLCGIRFFAFNKKRHGTIKNIVEKAHKEMMESATEYIDRHKWHFFIESYEDEMELMGESCKVLKVSYEMREDWKPIFGTFPKLEMADEKKAVPMLATFKYKNKGALTVWSLFNSENLLKILRKILGN